jgi:hypothetical protein
MTKVELKAIRRLINERLQEIKDEEHAAIVRDMAMPPGWGEDDGQPNDGDEERE